MKQNHPKEKNYRRREFMRAITQLIVFLLMISITKKIFFALKPTANFPRKTKAAFFIRNIMSESDQTTEFNTPRLVVKKVLAKLQHEGDGAVVRRGIGR